MASNILLITSRELRGYFSSFSGYLILSAHLLITGLLFNAYAIGNRPKFSQEVLEDFFYFSSGMAIVTAVLLSTRLIAEERQNQTLVLLHTAPVSERVVVYGKFLSALAFFSITLLASIYLPALVFVNGKISLGHIFSGYLGLFLLGSACIAIALVASSWTSSQLMAGAIGALMVTLLTVAWMAARVSDEPLRSVLNYLALHNQHFRTFSRGVFAWQDLAYYIGITVFFLEMAVRSLESWRWRE